MDPDQQSKQPACETDRVETHLSPDNVVFDEDNFLNYVGNDRALAHRVVGRFLADSPVRLTELETALRAGDATVVARTAHTLKGTVSLFSAAAAVRALRKIEALARADDLPRAADAFTALGREIPQLTSELRAFLACPSPTR